MPADETLAHLLAEVRACTLCSAHLPQRPRPVLQLGAGARILIAGQAPGRTVDASGIPFDDVSGDRLRAWLGMDRATFYDPAAVAILPMGFCYPGTGPAGDLPPRPECAPAWRQALLRHLPQRRLTLLVGHYAVAWHLNPANRVDAQDLLSTLKPGGKPSLTHAVSAWRDFPPHLVPMPHPSPRNQAWLRRNPWFEAELLPALKIQVRNALAPP